MHASCSASHATCFSATTNACAVTCSSTNILAVYCTIELATSFTNFVTCINTHVIAVTNTSVGTLNNTVSQT